MTQTEQAARVGPVVEAVEATMTRTLTEIGVLALGALIALAAQFALRRVLTQVAKRTPFGLDSILIRHLDWPTRLLIPTLVMLSMSTPMALGGYVGAVRHALSLALIGGVAWAVVAAINALEEFLLSRYDMSVSDNLNARSKHTQLRVVVRTIEIFAIVVAIAVMLMTFPRVRELGTSLLASAGLAGLVVGLSARPLLENIIAGLQIALTEPIRLDDVVIVSGEWGRVEEITATYVVVRIWDQRRLIVPLSHFLTNPFQNWTRTSAEMLGTAFLFLDYRAPIDAIRAELQRLCDASDKWDKRVCVVQVTDTKQREIEVRLLVSAANSGDLWDLRCAVREGILTFLQREHPEALPTTRVAWEDGKTTLREVEPGPDHPRG
ncbi:MAG: mechanosensitive ion channel [Phycisphaeraceae bacterium]|nr:mechanosensitive ion channel [Phycisphaeraceae bacterium]